MKNALQNGEELTEEQLEEFIKASHHQRFVVEATEGDVAKIRAYAEVDGIVYAVEYSHNEKTDVVEGYEAPYRVTPKGE